MRVSTLVLVTSAAIRSAVGAAVGGNAVDPINGYEMVDMSWAIEVAPGRVEILNGTVQEVVAQATEINPGFLTDELLAFPPAFPPAPAPAPAGKRRLLQRRTVKSCNSESRYADGFAIIEGVNYLRRVPGKPTLGPGPGECARVSCSKDSAIYWCNNSTDVKTVTWEAVANSAKYITDVCPWYGPDHPSFVSGQNSEDGKWNTVVRGDTC
ncbi:hypothetical protein B0H66DRAFT_616987 [Apodospora peruviana]|uniref:Uncharacterized protein n=1 Tax=Apodospora peruviana TaxID=516989 RepID=A0AAE0IJW4_9PEZI|nr:hypothetical protein B0H66DRAFT_616987 [Apodospora peruviana]